jgi:hypothetical protein
MGRTTAWAQYANSGRYQITHLVSCLQVGPLSYNKHHIAETKKLFSQLLPSLPDDHLPRGFPSKILFAFSLPCLIHMLSS